MPVSDVGRGRIEQCGVVFRRFRTGDDGLGIGDIQRDELAVETAGRVAGILEHG